MQPIGCEYTPVCGHSCCERSYDLQAARVQCTVKRTVKRVSVCYPAERTTRMNAYECNDIA